MAVVIIAAVLAILGGVGWLALKILRAFEEWGES